MIKKTKINFNILKITFINIRIIFSPNDYKKWGKNYLKTNFNENNWNLKTIFHILPFVFGFSNMIWSRYQDQTIAFLFGDNLPGTKPSEEKLSWETFKFIKSKTLDKNNIKKIDLYPTSWIIELKSKQKKNLIGIIFPDEKIPGNLIFSEKSFGDSKHFLIFFRSNERISKQNFVSQIQNIFYTLDELPIKIKNISEKSEKNSSSAKIFINELTELFNETEAKKSDKFPENKKRIHLPKNFTYSNEKVEKNNLTKGVQKFKSSTQTNTIRIENNIPHFRKTKKDILQDEFDSFFYKQGLKLNESDFSLNEFINEFSFLDYCSFETLGILKDFRKSNTSQIDSVRTITGYNFPDFSTKNVYKIKLNFIFQNSEKPVALKIEGPSNFITNLEENSLMNSNCLNLLPITYRKDNFFEPIIEEIEKKALQNEWKKALLKETPKQTTKTLEDFDDFDPDSWFLSFKEIEGIKEIDFEEKFLKEFLEKNDDKNYRYIKNNFFSPNYIRYHTIPFSENSILEQNKENFKITETYKRIPSFVTKLNKTATSYQKNSFSFFEVWEPISINSWLLITQFSTGFFLFNLLKDLYTDYGKELVEYILQFASSSGIDVEEIKEQYLYEDPGYRVIKKIEKSFKDVAGIDNILLQLGEIVWFLRNQGRSSKLKKSIPNGILLTGPPGTGKTLLVQAIAGEAHVPIIVESGSLLTDPQQKNRGVERLKQIFDHARELSPCILFIDEVDTLGEKRQQIIQTAMGRDELIESIYEKPGPEKSNPFILNPLNLEEEQGGEKDLEYQLFRQKNETSGNSVNEQVHQQSEANKTRLSLLTQFLIELDGLKQRQGVIVIGATNRPKVLDPALIRPGRFDQILNLELPGKQKRIEILKLYGKKLKIESNISWDYLAKRTRGFSAADIAAVMNESTIQSVIYQTTHTIETIERGIDLVTSYNYESKVNTNGKKYSDPFYLNRLAYYQSGKALSTRILPNQLSTPIFYLWPRQKNARHNRINEKSFSEITNRKELESQLIGLYSGKISEIIPLYGNKVKNSLKGWHSNLGQEDLLSGTYLANLLVDKWYFYSMQVLIRKNHSILTNRNEKEFNDLEKSGLVNVIKNEIEDELEIEKIAKLSRLGRYQQRGFGPWWQIQVAKQASEVEKFLADWYRIYLPDPEENIVNLEWIPPDEYHHSNTSLKTLSQKSNVSFNDLYKIERDYVFHGLILNAFNTAFFLIEEKREFLDYFADYLLRFELIRENEIDLILKTTPQREKDSFTQNIKAQSDFLKIFETFWGKNSRRKTYRFVQLEKISPSETKES